MSGLEMCRCCGQPLPSKKREGVYLPPKKACIFDFISQHPGVTSAGIRAHCFADGTNIKVIHVHIAQINDMLAGTNVQIKGEKRGGYNEPGLYRIVRRAARKWKGSK